MSARGPVHFSLHLGPYTEEVLLVRRIDGVEQLSTPFAMTVTFSTVDGEPIDLFRLVAREACLTIRRPDSRDRWVHGTCATADHAGTFAGRPLYRATIMPKLQFLAVKANCRVFQDQNAVDIVCALFTKAGIAFRRELRGAYPAREMCIQYRETDLAFISRLLEEEGITYWFEHEERQHTLVLGDAPESFDLLADGASLPYRQETGAFADEPHLFDLHRKSSVRPSRSIVRDFDFEHPSLDVTSSTPPSRGGEVFEYPSGNVQAAETKRLNQVRLEELQAEGEVWNGQGNCEWMAPGFTFGVTGHPRTDFEVRLLATRVTHHGMQQTSSGDAHRIESSYRNDCYAIRAGRQYRPPRSTSRPTIHGVQTATVVGPPGEEVHPDQYGRVKVQFHWDRAGALDDRASAWIRLAQSWSGPGFGALFVPRVGQEVVLRFLEGSPDRPIVSGAVYNGSHPPPVGLPADKTQSTLKTDSSPHNGGSNELRFEDAAGHEQVYLHGQKDETIEVRNNKDQVVHRNEQLRVDRDRSRSVRGDQLLQVAQNDSSRVQGNQSLTVNEDRTTQVVGDHTESISISHSGSVSGIREVSVRLASTEAVGAASALTIGGAYAVTVGGATNETVGALKNCQVGGAKMEFVGAARTEFVGGDYLATVGGDFDSDIAGGLGMTVGKNLAEDARTASIRAGRPASWSSKKIHITADEFELVVGGQVAISMKKDGTVRLSGRAITVEGAAVTARGSSLVKSGPAAAAQKKLSAKRLRAPRSAPSFVAVKMLDQHGRPVANEPLRVMFADKSIRTGATDSAGYAKVPAPRPGTCMLTLTRLDACLWTKKAGGYASAVTESSPHPLRRHIARRCDTISRIAAAHGIPWMALWHHPSNESLRKLRKNPNVLFEGDVVSIPGRQLKTIAVAAGRTHDLQVTVEETQITLRPYAGQTPRANAAFVLELDDGTRHEGRTDGGGYLSVLAPATVRSGRLQIETSVGVEYHTVEVGLLDPIEEPTGAQHRLRNLGLASQLTGTFDDQTRTSLAQFQESTGINPSSDLDDPTRKKLTGAQGS